MTLMYFVCTKVINVILSSYSINYIHDSGMTCSNNNVLNWIKEKQDKNRTHAKDTSYLPRLEEKNFS